MSSPNLAIQVTADTIDASRQLQNISSQVDKIVQKQNSKLALVSNFNTIGIAAQIASKAIKTVISVVDDLAGAFADQEQSETKLQSTLRATGNAIGLQATELYGMADSLAKVTTFSDQAIIGMQQIFIASGKISKEALPEVTELALDMAEALGVDATQAARDMAKFLSDPIKAIEELRSKNINLTESEKAKIKELQNSNKLHEAQQVILEKVAVTYGGIAREVANTDTGKITQIKNLRGDIKEWLGHAIVFLHWDLLFNGSSTVWVMFRRRSTIRTLPEI